MKKKEMVGKEEQKENGKEHKSVWRKTYEEEIMGEYNDRQEKEEMDVAVSK